MSKQKIKEVSDKDSKSKPKEVNRDTHSENANQKTQPHSGKKSGKQIEPDDPTKLDRTGEEELSNDPTRIRKDANDPKKNDATRIREKK